MVQLIATVILTIAVVVFAMANTHHVGLSYVLGAPVQVRLVVLLAASFLMGAVATIFIRMISQLNRRQGNQRLLPRYGRDDEDE